MKALLEPGLLHKAVPSRLCTQQEGFASCGRSILVLRPGSGACEAAGCAGCWRGSGAINHQFSAFLFCVKPGLWWFLLFPCGNWSPCVLQGPRAGAPCLPTSPLPCPTHGPHPSPLTLTHPPAPPHLHTLLLLFHHSLHHSVFFFFISFFLKPLEELKNQNKFLLPFPLSTGDGSE